MVSRAAFIVIEGLDRSGKSTQAAILHDRLVALGISTRLFKFPGKMIDSYLRSESELDDHAIHLLFSANRWELAPVILHLLNTGTTVLVDRYAFSGIAFSARKGLPYDWCRAPDAGLPAPDLTLFLDIDPETAKMRGGYGAERYEQEEVQRGVREVFQSIGHEMLASGARWVLVDAKNEKDKVAEVIWQHVEHLCQGIDSPIDKLWDGND